MRIIDYIKNNGIKHTIDVVWEYKLDIIIRKVMLAFVKNKKLKDIIVIESHNDFDSNGGAFYDYLIQKHYNKKYLIVWLIKNECKYNLPQNVKVYKLHKPSIMKNYYICMAKYFTADCEVTGKVRAHQKSYYLSHGTFSLKNSSGKIDIPSKVDYILIPSEFTRSIQAKQYRPHKQTNMISLGFPVHDKLLQECKPQLNKVVKDTKFNKIIIWMPTFRKGGGFNRNDSNIELPFGIPLITNKDEYNNLNNLLKIQNILLIIKIHPMQDMSTVKIKESKNIKLLTGAIVKNYQIDMYELLKETDALISDYSSISYDYLMLDRPIGYIFSDLKEYKNGLITNNPEKFIAGPIINTYQDFNDFILSVSNSDDKYKEKRYELTHKIFEFNDGHSCERLVKHMKLN